MAQQETNTTETVTINKTKDDTMNGSSQTSDTFSINTFEVKFWCIVCKFSSQWFFETYPCTIDVLIETIRPFFALFPVKIKSKQYNECKKSE